MLNKSHIRLKKNKNGTIRNPTLRNKQKANTNVLLLFTNKQMLAIFLQGRNL